MMRRGNYIWPKDILRLDRFVMKPETIEGQVQDIDASLPEVQQVLLWIEEDDHIARVAYEVIQERPRLIGIEGGSGVEFAGVGELLECHTQRDDFTMIIVNENLPAAERAQLDAGTEYISEFNRVLSRWWEQERSSCE
jgi:predicted metal-dependent peptidase